MKTPRSSLSPPRQHYPHQENPKRVVQSSSSAHRETISTIPKSLLTLSSPLISTIILTLFSCFEAYQAHIAMASSFSISSSSTIIDSRAPPSSRQASASSPSCVSLPTLPIQSQNRAAKATSSCRKIVRNVVTRATEVGTTTEVAELPEIVKTAQETWEKVEDKYAIGSLAFAGFVALWGSTGLISAIDRLPLVPGVFELVGIGYTGWFTYKNLIFKPDREALFQKIKNTYKDILGTS